MRAAFRRIRCSLLRECCGLRHRLSPPSRGHGGARRICGDLPCRPCSGTLSAGCAQQKCWRVFKICGTHPRRKNNDAPRVGHPVFAGLNLWADKIDPSPIKIPTRESNPCLHPQLIHPRLHPRSNPRRLPSRNCSSACRTSGRRAAASCNSLTTLK